MNKETLRRTKDGYEMVPIEIIEPHVEFDPECLIEILAIRLTEIALQGWHESDTGEIVYLSEVAV